MRQDLTVPEADSSDDHTRRSIRAHLLLGMGAFVAFFAIAGGIAWSTVLSGAVIAHGTVVVDSSVKKVQHLDGGIVAEIHVKEGDHVSANDVLLKLDPTIPETNLSIVVKGLDQNIARLARLEAERDGAASVQFPDVMISRQGIPDVASIMNGEQRLFAARVDGRAGRVLQLKERAAQLREEIGGIEAQVAGKTKEIQLINEELKGTRSLWAKQLIPIQRVTAIEREAARLEGERGALVASIARSRAGIAETELQILQVDQDARTDIATDIRDAQAKIAELSERRVAAEETLRRLDVRSPQTGIVHELAVHTVGGVVQSGAVLMEIVPQQDRLRIDARLSPDQVDQVFASQKAIVNFSAFDRGTTPELVASVSMISPDLNRDEKTGQTFFMLHLDVGDDELTKLGALKLMPGMPAEIFIQTSSRTIISYLIKPLTDQMNRSLRE
ncbi:HlyD family type I secretion periplasmic adaptor subunit [Flaviflagellibacter deserti]|uniref:Membrane fusion protein (MFP) family protein n=2 Tax=Flaviflagellibacter deserti TaxID=2267266 RepID=A0ABV9Z5M0_9HYPH